MIFKSSVFKLVLGGLSVLMAGAGLVYFINYVPQAPTLKSVVVNQCQPLIDWIDNSTNEEDFRVYRSDNGAQAFKLRYILRPQAGKGSTLGIGDVFLPLGSYEYKVGAYNAIGESLSNSLTIIIGDCSNLPNVIIPPINNANLPSPPLIMDLSVINDCNVRINYRDNSTNEQGLRVYRYFGTTSGSYGQPALIANLGVHNGIPGSFTDPKLATGFYLYKMSAYNQNGEAFSWPYEIEVAKVCDPTYQFLPTQIPAPLVINTPQKLSSEACLWTAVKNTFLRKGPDVGLYDKLDLVEAGQGFPIVGQSEDGQFWAVQARPGVGYITKSETYSRTDGDCSSVPTVKDPPPPVIKESPTEKPDGGDDNSGDPAPSCTPIPGYGCP